MEFREVCDSDLGGIFESFKVIFNRNFGSEEAYAACFKTNRGSYTSFVVEGAGGIKGHMGFFVRELIGAGKVILCASRHSTFLMPDYQGIGLYKKMLEFSFLRLAQSKIQVVQAWPNSRNTGPTSSDSRFAFSNLLPLLTLKNQNTSGCHSFSDKYKRMNQFPNLSDDFLVCSDSSNYFGVRKNYDYVYKRYIQRDLNEAKYFFDGFGDAFVIFSVSNDRHDGFKYVNVLDMFGSVNTLIAVLDAFILDCVENGYQMRVSAIYYNKLLFSYLVSKGFEVGHPIFATGFYILDSCLQEHADLIRGGMYAFSLGDTDAF